MAFKIKGWNEFYEGWLSRCLEQPFDKDEDEEWREGWIMGAETDEAGRLNALVEEIRRGQLGTSIPEAHIVVEEMAKSKDLKNATCPQCRKLIEIKWKKHETGHDIACEKVCQ